MRRTNTVKSPPAAVFSYYANRSSVPTQRGRKDSSGAAQKKPRLMLLRHTPTLVAVAVIVGTLFYATTLSTNPHVRHTDTNPGALIRPVGAYQAYASQQLSASTASQSKLTIDTDEVAAKIVDHFPELQDASVTIPLLGRRPIVQLVATQPAFIISSSDGDFYLSDTGRVIIRVGDSVGRPERIMTIVDQSQVPVSPGQQ
ncbi:MAG TPA: hypothetical protein VF598_12475, partial [Hymenobacter sp.]